MQQASSPAAMSARRGARESTRAAMIAAALAAATLPAQAQFTSLTGFGDSYADTGAAPGGAFRLIPSTYPPPGAYYHPCAQYYTSCEFTGSTNFVDSLRSIYGLPGLTNYSIGGARTDNTNTIPPLSSSYGLPYELNQFALSGTHFTNTDLIALSIGGNDMTAIDLSGLNTDAQKTALIEASAANSAKLAVAGVEQLVGAGARNIAWLSTGNSKYFPVPPSGVNGVNFTDPQRDAWANTYFQQTQQLLRPLAEDGVRIFLFNFGVLQDRIANNPGQYGFAGLYGFNGLNILPTPVDDRCQAVPSTPASNYVPNCFYYNAVHPTGAAMALIATYMANQIDAPTTVVPQGGIATGLAQGFTTSVLGRLDAQRGLPALAEGYKDGGPESPWSVYGDVNYGGGNLERQFLAAGYDYDAIGGMVGAEYRVNPLLLLGGVFGYSTSSVNLGVQNAHDNINSYQLAAYGSFTGANLFSDALIAYGRHDYTLDRQGVIDIVHGSTSADTFTAAARAGYLFDAGPVRVGPIAGLNYTRADIQAYTETGDSLLTMMVNEQNVDSLTGNAGIQMRVPFQLWGDIYSPFINVTAEQDLLGSGRVITTTQVTAPLLPVLTPVPGESGTYGKIAAGVAARLGGTVSATLNAETTFAREGGNGLVVSGGIKMGL